MKDKVKSEMYDVNTDIMRIGDTYYAIKRIEAKSIDINEELKELYEQRHARHVDQLNKGIVSDAQEDWHKQIEHVRSFDGRGAITIPQRLFGKPVMEHNGYFLELRVITYSPNQVQGVREYFREVVDNVMELPRGTLHVNIKPSFSIPLLVGYCSRTKKLFTPLFRTFHTFGSGDVCTGNSTGEAFWRLSDEDLEREMNRVNLMSPANQTVHIGDMDYPLRSLYTRDKIISINERSDNVWSV